MAGWSQIQLAILFGGDFTERNQNKARKWKTQI